jgi:GxxExxY protein
MSKLLYEEETYKIRGAVFEVYKEMGPGFLEAVYQECLERELRLQEMPYESQKELCLYYKGEQLEQTYKPDFYCFDEIIVEIKAIKKLLPTDEAQLLNYLHGTNKKLGLLVNFGASETVEIKRFVL